VVGRFVGHFFRAAPLMRLAIQIYWWRRRHTLIAKLMDLVEDRLAASGQIDRTRPPGFWRRLKTWLGLGGGSGESKAAARQGQPAPDQSAT
jgi:hypothetical protein